ncbi:MAG TPA: tripartite tricarboxylate transporter substrate binding protein [Hyphomicrobiales bacterium]|nr:tripartite tricarboxylate transporter substrate binding protein [Hyphomicrobiales bacterium]
MIKKSMNLLTGGVAVLALALGASAEKSYAEYPEKPVEMTILFGSTANTIGQLLADLMSKNLEKPVVAVSRTGGGGAVGYKHVHSTPADGYNIVWNSNSISTSHYNGNIDFTYEDFVPIARISTEVPALAVRSDSGWNTLAEMIEAVKKSDKKLKVGISGKGSFTHLTSVALFDAAGIGDKIVYVPYDRGRAPAELLGSRIDAALQFPGQFVSHAEAGTLKILAVTSDERIKLLPDVPTAKEEGVDMNITMWRGLAAPKGTPPEVVKSLEEAAQKASESKEFIDASEKIGFTPAYLPSEKFGELIASDDKKISKLMDDLGLKK